MANKKKEINPPVSEGQHLDDLIDAIENKKASWIPVVLVICTIIGAVLALRGLMKDDIKEAIGPTSQNLEEFKVDFKEFKKEVKQDSREVKCQLNTMSRDIKSEGQLVLLMRNVSREELEKYLKNRREQ